MIIVDLSKYSNKFTPLYDLKIADQIVRDHNLAKCFEDVEIVVPNDILIVSKRFFYNLLNERFYNYPMEKTIKKSIKITTNNKGIKDNFNDTVSQLLKERKSTDMKLHIRVK